MGAPAVWNANLASLSDSTEMAMRLAHVPACPLGYTLADRTTVFGPKRRYCQQGRPAAAAPVIPAMHGHFLRGGVNLVRPDPVF